MRRQSEWFLDDNRRSWFFLIYFVPCLVRDAKLIEFSIETLKGSIDRHTRCREGDERMRVCDSRSRPPGKPKTRVRACKTLDVTLSVREVRPSKTIRVLEGELPLGTIYRQVFWWRLLIIVRAEGDFKFNENGTSQISLTFESDTCSLQSCYPHCLSHC